MAASGYVKLVCRPLAVAMYAAETATWNGEGRPRRLSTNTRTNPGSALPLRPVEPPRILPQDRPLLLCAQPLRFHQLIDLMLARLHRHLMREIRRKHERLVRPDLVVDDRQHRLVPLTPKKYPPLLDM